MRKRLTLENDDVVYTVADLHPVCEDLGLPLVYDVHHHRCLPDGLTVEEATRVTVATWERLEREPYFHLSSPAHGWQGKMPRMHADYVDVNDLPEVWKTLSATIDVEARAKELAVMKLMRDLDVARQGS